MDVMLTTLIMMTAFTGGAALSCIQCSSLEFHSGNSALEKLLGGKTDAACEQGGGSWVTCPDGAVCGSYKGQVDGQHPIFGALSMKVTARDCAVDWTSDTGCFDSNDADSGFMDIINGLLSFLIGFGEVQVSGKVCTCSTSGCNDQNLDCNGLSITDDFCMAWWLLGVIIGGAVLVLILLFTCCCCCCGCCRKTPRPAVVYSPAVVMGGIGAIENPGYNQPV